MIPFLILCCAFVAVALWLLSVAVSKHRDCTELAAKNRVLNAALAAKSTQIAETVDVLNECRDVIAAANESEVRRLAATRRLRGISAATDGLRADLIRQCKELEAANEALRSQNERLREWQRAMVADVMPSAGQLDKDFNDSPEEG